MPCQIHVDFKKKKTTDVYEHSFVKLFFFIFTRNASHWEGRSQTSTMLLRSFTDMRKAMAGKHCTRPPAKKWLLLTWVYDRFLFLLTQKQIWILSPVEWKLCDAATVIAGNNGIFHDFLLFICQIAICCCHWRFGLENSIEK